MTFSFWLKKFRQRTKISGRAFSRSLGIDSGNYCKYETGSLIAGADFIGRFSQAASLNETETALLHALASRERILRFIEREVPK
jgi:hypothetical protein